MSWPGAVAASRRASGLCGAFEPFAPLGSSRAAEFATGNAVRSLIVSSLILTSGSFRDVARFRVVARAPESPRRSTCSWPGALSAATVDGRARTSVLIPSAQPCSASSASTRPRTSGTAMENVRPPGPVRPIFSPADTALAGLAAAAAMACGDATTFR
jgi:hypothetical protein